MTDAGQRLLAWLQKHYQLAGYPLDKFVAAIEAEAAQEAVRFGTALLHDAHVAATPPAPEGLPLATAAQEKMRCGWCGDWLRLEDLEGHLASEGRTLPTPPTPAEPPRLAAILAAEHKYDALDLETEYQRGYQEGYASGAEARPPEGLADRLLAEIARVDRGEEWPDSDWKRGYRHGLSIAWGMATGAMPDLLEARLSAGGATKP